MKTTAHTFQPGDTVTVRTELGTEPATVIGQNLEGRVTVEFADRTRCSFPSYAVSKLDAARLATGRCHGHDLPRTGGPEHVCTDLCTVNACCAEVRA